MKISVVDQSPIFSNSNADEAIKETESCKVLRFIRLKSLLVGRTPRINILCGCSPEILIQVSQLRLNPLEWDRVGDADALQPLQGGRKFQIIGIFVSK